VWRADSFHWHAESSHRLWSGVHAHDEASRDAAFAAAAAAGVSGPYQRVLDIGGGGGGGGGGEAGGGGDGGDEDGGDGSGDEGFVGPVLPAPAPGVTAAERAEVKRELRRRAELAVAPQLGPDLMRSGPTSTLLDDLGLLAGAYSRFHLSST
jgi:hypothetical protein